MTSSSTYFLTLLLISFLLSPILHTAHAAIIDGELKAWHRVSLTFVGPSVCESDSINPFLDYRLNVVLTNGALSFTIPGFYAADGNAAETGAACGNKWQIHFSPPASGSYTYTAEFQSGPGIAISELPGTATSFDGESGNFTISPTDKTGIDFRGKGMLRYANRRFMRFQKSKEYFVIGGAASPENLLAYKDFDSTYTDAGPTDDDIHEFLPHVADWNSGDPVWQGTKGKGIIGAMNYLSEEGMNIQFMLTFSEGGDGDDIWPWTTPTGYKEYDVSKLGQWEILFDHMDKVGIVKHLILQERENDQYLDLGELGPDRKLYYREMIARFGHHLGLIWNIGEENTNTALQRQEFISYIKANDPYQHLVIVHTYAFDKPIVYGPLLGNPEFDGGAMHISNYTFIDDDFLEWSFRSDTSGRPWVLFLSEIGPVTDGVLPDDVDPSHDVPRTMLWNVLFHGGAGAEWYFGRNYPNNDVNCEDLRSRDIMWKQTKIALDFWNLLPFEKMRSRDDLVSRYQTWCYALNNNAFLVNLPNGDDTNLTISVAGNYRLGWFDPVNGGPIMDAGIFNMPAAGTYTVENPPGPGDWVAIILKKGALPKLENEFVQTTDFQTFVSVNPNPAAGIARFSIACSAPQAQLFIHDRAGREIFSSSISGSFFELNTSSIPNGMYFWKLISVEPQMNALESGKLVIQH